MLWDKKICLFVSQHLFSLSQEMWCHMYENAVIRKYLSFESQNVFCNKIYRIVFLSHNMFVFYLTTLVLCVSQYIMSFLNGKYCETKRFVFLSHNICLRYMMPAYKEGTMLRDERHTFCVTTLTCMHVTCVDLYIFVCERCWNML